MLRKIVIAFAIGTCMVNAVPTYPEIDPHLHRKRDLQPAAHVKADGAALVHEIRDHTWRSERSGRREPRHDITRSHRRRQPVNSTTHAVSVAESENAQLERTTLERRKAFNPGSARPLYQDPSAKFPDRYVVEMHVKRRQPSAADMKFFARVDTTIADVVVPGKSCDSCPGSIEQKYDEGGVRISSDNDEAGKAAMEHFVDQTLFESYVGEQFTDTVEVNGVNVRDKLVFSVSQMKGGAQSYEGVMQSILGIGFKIESRPDDDESFFDKLSSRQDGEQNTEDQEICFFHGRRSPDARRNTQHLSELSIGGRNPALFSGTVRRMECQNPVWDGGQRFWEVPLWGASVSDQVIPGFDFVGTAVFDTGGAFIVAPQAATIPIYSRVPGAILVDVSADGFTRHTEPQTTTLYPRTYDYYAYPCGARPKVSISLGGFDDKFYFEINPLDLNLGEIERDDPNFRDVVGGRALADARAAGTVLCFSALVGTRPQERPQGGSDPITWTLGTPFLKNWYAIFTNAGTRSVSLAKAIDDTRRHDDPPSGEVIETA